MFLHSNDINDITYCITTDTLCISKWLVLDGFHPAWLKRLVLNV